MMGWYNLGALMSFTTAGAIGCWIFVLVFGQPDTEDKK